MVFDLTLRAPWRFGYSHFVPLTLIVLATLSLSVVFLGATIGRQAIRKVQAREKANLVRHSISAVTLAVGVLVLMYSTAGTNLNGLWDSAHPFLNSSHAIVNPSTGSLGPCQYSLPFNLDACRRDIVGGLLYWLSQDKVARGHQPWYYYGLIFGLYEQLAIVFGGVVIVRTLLGRALAPSTRAIRLFFTYWAVMAVGVYSWAGERSSPGSESILSCRSQFWRESESRTWPRPNATCLRRDHCLPLQSFSSSWRPITPTN